MGEKKEEEEEEAGNVEGERKEGGRDRSSLLGSRQHRLCDNEDFSACSCLIILSTPSFSSVSLCLSIVYESHYRLCPVITIPPVMMRGEWRRKKEGRREQRK